MKKYTTDTFLKKIKDIHGDKYDYSESVISNIRTKIKIKCNVCGNIFWQTPKNHLKGQGCPECGKKYASSFRKYGYKSFIEKQKNLYGSKYSFPYIDREYENNKSIITIRCNDCGYEFKKRPNDFLNHNGFKGCKQCRLKQNEEKKREKLEKLKRLKESKPKLKKQPIITKEIYLNRFKEKFGNNLEPFIDEYVDTQKKIHFKCNICGNIFERNPNNCLRSKGCPKCNNIRNARLTNEEFIECANNIHNYKYDYSQVEYINTDTKVKVICHEIDEFGQEHGEFLVTPHSHIGSMKSGCPKCSGKYGSKDRFIKLANEKYNNLYCYDNFVYEGAFKKSFITCKEHGDFLCSPNRHLNGQMCPKCIGSSMEREMSSFLDANNIDHKMRKHFDWLGNQEIDIYIPKYNIAIECQGEHHFMPIDFYGGEEEFVKIKELDEKKKYLCEENGIKLLYYSNLGIDYPYEVFEDKEKILQKILDN